MIRQGRQEGWFKFPSSALQPWATLNGVSLNGVAIGTIPGFEYKGSAVLAINDLTDSENSQVMVVPRDLILSLESIENHAKTDKHLAEVLTALGSFGRTTRGAVLTFLLMQATLACPDIPRGVGVSNPLTEYAAFLPEESLPTFWNDEELKLLEGTSLHTATKAKLRSLNHEFEQLRSSTEEIDWCDKYWWDSGLVTLDDWKQVDAMYRSRALEFPGIGDSMAPCIDMANHAPGNATAAVYETNSDGDAILLLRDGKQLQKGDEVTITYGDEKGACEMIFSYGFLDDTMDSARIIFLDLPIPNDDPLKAAKAFVASSAPGFRVFEDGDDVKWESDFVYLALINEEDGLDLKVLQTTSGEREIKMFWKEEEVMSETSLRTLLQADPMKDLFELRAVALIQSRVEDQLQILYQSNTMVEESASDDTSTRPRVRQLAGKLRELEFALLERVYETLEGEKLKLLETSAVKDYLALHNPEPHLSEPTEADFS